MLGPASLKTLVLTAMATAVATTAVVLVWRRLRGPRALQVVQRFALVGLCQVLAVVLAFAVVNHQYQFYLRWGELVGSTDTGQLRVDPGVTTAPLPSVASSTDPDDTPLRPVAPVVFTRDSAGVSTAHVTGPTSGVQGDLFVWTTPDYSPSGPAASVILSLPGHPGSPETAITDSGLQKRLTQKASAGVVGPTVLVSATIDPTGTETDCQDVPGGPAVDTWFAQDVPALVAASFHVDPSRPWPVMGISSGASCAIRLALAHPRRYGPAVSVAGQNEPTSAVSGAPDLRTLVAAGATTHRSVLAAASVTDQATYRDAKELQQAAGPGITVDVEVLASGGHNWDAWALMYDGALDWVLQHDPSG